MKFGNKVYWAVALVAILSIAGTAVTLTSRMTSAGSTTPSPSASACDQQDAGGDPAETANGPDTDTIEADDAADAKDAPDTDNIDEECGP